jgi:hypothetical protein
MKESGKTKVVNLPKELVEQFEAIKRSRQGPGIKYTPEMDELIMRFWPISDQSKFAKIFLSRYGVGCISSIKIRYAKLTSESGKK